MRSTVQETLSVFTLTRFQVGDDMQCSEGLWCVSCRLLWWPSLTDCHYQQAKPMALRYGLLGLTVSDHLRQQSLSTQIYYDSRRCDEQHDMQRTARTTCGCGMKPIQLYFNDQSIHRKRPMFSKSCCRDQWPHCFRMNFVEVVYACLQSCGPCL
ncbi:hypothetical protein BDZ85DRAFT_263048 [Elsinoe ampelina]|uniref:Uncharacterized protein n=1 Tax=Elsinoe ampelina TaxID=302913 RepID=A0A6A6GBN0_9PEZI|nr:hypothetical protein BDZ85DRAFT_263048 [Elsinoe ampelina]